MSPDSRSDPGGLRIPPVRVVRNADEAGTLVAGRLTDAARDAVAQRGRFTLAIPGGSSPKSVFAKLGDPARQDAFPWNRTHLLWVDERAVPVDHPDSNYGAFAQDVLPGLPLDPDRVHRMPGELGPDEGAEEYRATLDAVLGFRYGATGVLDAVLLGTGEDGHVASLFPGAPTLTMGGTVIGITDSPKPPPERITLTMPVLQSARLVIVLGLGAGKADAVARALAGEPLPALFASQGDEALWVIDDAAKPSVR